MSEPGIPNYRPPYREQLDGTEYSGIQPTVAGGIQPKPSEALKNGEILRLDYVTGQHEETRRGKTASLDDHRQMMGLDTAKRPLWLDGVNDEDDSRKISEARRQGFVNDTDL